MSVDAPADREDRIGAGGITAGQLQADAAKSHQAAVDAKLASWFASEHDVYDADGLLDIGRHRP